MYWTKDLEKKYLIESYIKDWDERKKLEKATDDEIIEYFNTNKPKRVFPSFSTAFKDNFYGKYYTYENGKLELKDSWKNIIDDLVSIISNLDDTEIEILKCIADLFINEVEKFKDIAFYSIKMTDVVSEYSRRTGLSLGYTGRHWSKIYATGLVGKPWRRDIAVVPELMIPLKDAIKKYEESKTVITVTHEFEEIPDDLFSCIIGRDEIKELLLDALKAPKPVHVILIGNEASGKTLFLMEIARLKGAVYFSAGGRIGKAGLTDVLFEFKPKYLLIDEIALLKSTDASVLLSLTETGVVTKAVRGDYDTITLDTKVFGAAHPWDYDRLPKDFLDRFTLVELEPYTDDELKKIMITLLSTREGLNEESAKYIAEKLIENDIKSIREAVRIARLCGNNLEKVDKYVKLLFKGKYSKES